MPLIYTFLGAYILGSIPFGVLVTRARGVDVTKVGSGNVGATNVVRAVGWQLGVLVLILDVAKGLIPTLLAHQALGSLDSQTVSFLAGAVAILGHCFSPFLGFKGGKGIATSLGAVIGAAPLIAAGAFAAFVVSMLVTRFVSLSSIIAMFSACVLVVVLPGQSPQLVGIFLALLVFVVYRHRANIQRLRNGTEPKFSFKRSPETAASPRETDNGSRQVAKGSWQAAKGSRQVAKGSRQVAKGSWQVAEGSWQAEDSPVRTEDSSIQPEESVLQAEESVLQPEDRVLQAEESALQAEEGVLQVEESPPQVEEPGSGRENQG